MADAADRAKTAGAEFAPAPPAGRPGPGAVHGITTAPDAPQGPAYKPLSLAAVTGFVLALFYSAFIVVGSLFTFVTGDHFLLAPWTILLPVVVIGVCLFGRWAVAGSLGSLGGLKLANWGVGLTVVCGLAYWSYYAATLLALRQQAISFVESQYIPTLKAGKVEEAFLLTFTPPRPKMPADELRAFIEQNINMQVSIRAAGRYTVFTQTDYVRLMQMGGDATKMELVKAGAPTMEKGGMEEQLTYHVSTPIKAFDVVITARATEAATGREWQIMETKTGTLLNTTSWNDEGTKLFQKNEPAAREFANNWISKVAANLNTEGAFFDTLPSALRAKLAPKIKGKSEAQLIKDGETDPDLRNYVAGLKAFRAGSVIHADPKQFWAPENAREDFLKEVKKKFQTGYATNAWIQLGRGIPLWEEKDKKIRFYYDTYITLLPQYVATGQLVLEADADQVTADAAAKPDAWHLVRMDMIRSHAAPRPEPQNPR
jgi:hypothetical protein